MDANFEIKGLKKLNQELKALPEDFRSKALNGAVAAATRPMRDDAIRLVSKSSGNLASAIFAGKAPKKKQFSKWVSQWRVSIRKKGKIRVTSRGNGKTSYWRNTTYAKYLEEGSSKSSGDSFMRVAFHIGKRTSVRTFKRILEKKIAFYNRKIQRLRK
jgi:HK97 gp10 family phage protein